jgi:shikimate kinase
MRYFIIGYKNSGKTSIGKKLAKQLKMEFIDLDDVIEERERKSIPNLYTELGDELFRIKEWEALKEVVNKDNLIVSLGGGTPCHCDNMNLIEKFGEVIYIHLDNDTLVSRLKDATKDRPIVLNKSDEELRHYVNEIRDRCEHHYQRAKYHIEGKNLTVDKIIEAIQSDDK